MDPLATGVLVVCVGPATRLIRHVQQLPKTYQATFRLGQTSPSDDTETEMTPVPTASPPPRAAIEAALPNFVGQILQRPPAYSALKVGGRRAYQLARQGHQVQLEPRPTTIYRLSVTAYNYPDLQLSLQCGSGTYVRSIGRDLAESLGTGAVMSALTRTAIGPYELDHACTVEQVSTAPLTELLLPPATAVAHLPQLTLSEPQLTEIRHGRMIPHPTRLPAAELRPPHEIAAFNAAGELVALLQQKKPGHLRPSCNFSGYL